jgi:aldehyde dehydrogenase (NAD+)
MVDDAAFARVEALLARSVEAGARVECGGIVEPRERYIAPTVLTNVGWESPAMQEEIFGPVLLVVTYRSLEDVVHGVNRRGQPLALYMFSRSDASIEQVLSRTPSGGVALNTAMVHFANPYLPFGGVRQSGIGSYHGWYGFRTFSHERSILRQRPGGGLGVFDPPYRRKAGWLLTLLERAIR